MVEAFSMASGRSEIEKAAERAKIKAALKAQYIKQAYNPYRFINGNQPVFDPAVQRYISMKASQTEYFKPSPKTSFVGLATLLPGILLGIVVYNTRESREHRYRTGQVAYKDRRPKLV